MSSLTPSSLNPAVSLHLQVCKRFEDKWLSILLLLVSPIIKVQGSFATCEELTHTQLLESFKEYFGLWMKCKTKSYLFSGSYLNFLTSTSKEFITLT